jgi:predicted acylesterase/phospholipase RssA
MGVVDGLRDGGIPVDKGPMLGTSAGAWTAASVAAGVTHDELLERSDGFERTDDPVRVIELTRAVFGEHRDARVSGMVIELPLGLRKSLNGEVHDLADVVAASSSPPKFAHPHWINGRRFIDAGILRGTSVDRAETARVLVVVAPISGNVLGPFGRAHEQMARMEIQHWRMRSGRGDVLFVRPNRELAAMVNGRKLEGLLDPEVGRRAYEPSYDLGRESADRFLARKPRVVEEFDAISDN